MANGNEALQKRAGKNPASKTETKTPFVTGRSFAQIAKAAPAETLLVSGSGRELRVVPIINGNLGIIFNRSGNSINYSTYFIDELGNEYLINTTTVNSPGIRGLFIFQSPFILLEGEKIVLKVNSGDPNLSEKASIFSVLGTVSENEVYPARVEIPGTGVVDLVSPPEGIFLQAWPGEEESESVGICNGDSIDHNFNFVINNGIEDISVGTKLVQAGQINNVLEDLTEFDCLSLSEGQTLKVQMQEAKQNASSRILFVGTFNRVGLSRDPNQ